jgi:hypothetical protein
MKGLSATVALLLAACAPAPPRFECGAASADITPPVEPFQDLNGNGRLDKHEPFEDINGNGKRDTCFIAGFGIGKTALGVHDPLWARAVAFRRGDQKAILVECDLVGLLNYRCRQYKRKIEALTGVPARNITIAATHNHSGPDTIGLWGPLPGVSGVQPEYLESLEAGIVQAARQAWRNLRPASAVFADPIVEGITKDIREPVVMNERAAAALFAGGEGPIAVLVAWASHPEAIWSRNRLITSDYPHFLRQKIEAEYPGAVAVHISADIGGMQTPKVEAYTFEEVRRIGETLAARVVEELRRAPQVQIDRMNVAYRPVELRVDNARFKAGVKGKLFGHDETAYRMEGEDLFFTTELTAIRLGDALFVSVPGEMFPELAREVYAAMDARHKFFVGLGNDEIGYILPKEGWLRGPKGKAGYEETMSLGPETGPALVDAIREMLRSF